MALFLFQFSTEDPERCQRSLTPHDDSSRILPATCFNSVLLAGCVCCSGNREGGQTELDSGTQEGALPAPHGEELAHSVR